MDRRKVKQIRFSPNFQELTTKPVFKIQPNRTELTVFFSKKDGFLVESGADIPLKWYFLYSIFS